MHPAYAATFRNFARWITILFVDVMARRTPMNVPPMQAASVQVLVASAQRYAKLARHSHGIK